jgi:hypothetical protein
MSRSRLLIELRSLVRATRAARESGLNLGEIVRGAAFAAGNSMSKLELTTSQPQQPASPVCGYFWGKPQHDACQRCHQPWTAHYPARPRRRVRGVVAEVCSVCAYSTDSDQHVKHCRS